MVQLGVDNLLRDLSKYGLSSKTRAGLMTCCTGISGAGASTVDLLHESINLVKLFAPEHGIRSEFQAGVRFDDYADKKTGLPVISLYGDKRRPTKEMLDDIDVMIFDIQDAGARFYTYLYGMSYAMQSCAEFGKRMIVLDRPNPINALDVEGNILDLEFKSFIGYHPITQRFALTVCEAARLFNEEYGIGCDLTVVPMTGYERGMYFEDTGLMWVLPSPNIPTVETALAFVGTCIFEGTNVSEGRGTTKPFHFIGAPYIDAERLADKLNSFEFPGAFFRPHYFVPTFSKYKDEMCAGVELHITNRKKIKPVKVGTTMLYTIREMFPEFKFNAPYREGSKHMIDFNTGSDAVRLGTYPLNELLARYDEDSKVFAKTKEKYHLY